MVYVVAVFVEHLRYRDLQHGRPARAYLGTVPALGNEDAARIAADYAYETEDEVYWAQVIVVDPVKTPLTPHQ